MSTPPSISPMTSYPKDKIKILLLENIHASAVELFKAQGFQVDWHKGSLSEDEIVAKLEEGAHALGVRSKTLVTDRIMRAGRRLLAVGCFCIGTDQVDLDAAEKLGVPVFNAPFANTRSVAELCLAEVIMLARKAGDRSMEVHKGIWNKTATSCYEVRGKTLGIIGYGHVGSQFAILAEAIGMNVIFYDVIPKLPLGNSKARPDLESVLRESDFVTIHTPLTEHTKNMIGREQIAMMKKGSYLINAARGQVLDVEALAEALKSEHLAGAAVDVYPSEPEKNSPGFLTPLQGCPNTILTPHIGGSTEEAQAKIGEEVAISIIKLINQGATTNSVNFPSVDLPMRHGTHRIINIHKNQPGVLRDINQILSHYNVSGQYLSTTANIGFMIIDLDHAVSHEVKEGIIALEANIKTRILY